VCVKKDSDIEIIVFDSSSSSRQVPKVHDKSFQECLGHSFKKDGEEEMKRDMKWRGGADILMTG